MSSVDTTTLPPHGPGRTRRALVALAVITVVATAAFGTSLAATTPSVTQAALGSGLRQAVRLAPPTTLPPTTLPPTTVPPVTVPPVTVPPVTVAPTTVPGQLPAEVQAVLDRTNAERANAGLAPLIYHVDLARAAAIHGTDQRNKPCASGSLTHTGSDGSNAGDRIRRTGLSVSTWGENIACGYTTAQAVMDGWMNSTGHRQNILNPSFTHIGISLTYSDSGRAYWVQVFATPR